MTSTRIRIRITVPDRLLSRIEKAAEIEGTNVPRFILEASLAEANFILKASSEG